MTTTTRPVAPRWRKSSYSAPNGGECVEWDPALVAVTGTIPVRDSKCPDGPVLMVSAAAFTRLVTLAKRADN
ncbi:DUF397 domain-containing protein [Streptomyces sp. NPDC020875]|uniref:DUF397 domain-containing protein n=1 Tax=Streptomyces sp. NPDC020875 TaxID=3154898 RepID=UPI0033CBC4B1